MLFPARYTPPLSEDFPTDGDRLIALVSKAWRTEDGKPLELDEWQKWLLRAILERYPDDHKDPLLAGHLRWRQCVVSVPRQSGKSLLGAILGVYGLLMHMPNGGAQVLGIASSLEQAMLIYKRVHFVVTNPEKPWLTKRFKKATERRGILTADGSSRYDIKPAKSAALQGVPISLCLFDEGHLAKEGLWTDAIQGTTSFEDGLVLMITTAGDEKSETLKDLYKTGQAAIDGDPSLERFGFFVWEAPEGCAIDEKAILSSNPAVESGRIPLDRVLSDLRSVPEREARRYRLNQFANGSYSSWLPAEYFHKCAGSGISEIEGSVLALDITGRYEFATIAAAKKNGDIVETEIVAEYVQPSDAQLYKELTDLYRRHRVRAIAMDIRKAPALAHRLKDNGFIVYRLSTGEVSAATAQAYAMFETGKVIHSNDQRVIAQLPKGVAKYVGESWFLSRRDSLGDIDALLATIFAMYVANTQNSSGIGVF